MHLLIASPHAGTARWRYDALAARLAAEGVSCTLAAPGLRTSRGDVEHVVLPESAHSPAGAALAALALSSRWGDRRPDAVIVESAPLARAVHLTAQVFRVPACIALLDRPHEGRTRQIDRLAPLTASDGLALLVAGSDALPFGSGVDASRFDPRDLRMQDRIRAERAALLPTSGQLVGAVGGVDRCQALAQTLRLARPQARVLPLGVADLGASGAARIAACDAVVFCADHEAGADLALLCAAMRRPIVVAEGAVPRRIARLGGGVLSATSGPTALRDALLPLLDDPLGSRRVGAAGRRLVEHEASREQAEQTVLRAVDELLRARFGAPVHLTADGRLVGEPAPPPRPTRSGRRDLLGD